MSEKQQNKWHLESWLKFVIKKVKYIMKEKKLGDTQHNDLQLCFIGGKKGLYLLSYRYQYFRQLKK